ncbi:mucin-5AC [Sardina pilchardus]|uniref:mucin-5AC n=1 Tax=Sardina pilchardus TaxID=27697 RepID=UPI002E0DDAA5
MHNHYHYNTYKYINSLYTCTSNINNYNHANTLDNCSDIVVNFNNYIRYKYCTHPSTLYLSVSTLLRTMHNHHHYNTYKYINSLDTYNSNINNNYNHTNTLDNCTDVVVNFNNYIRYKYCTHPSTLYLNQGLHKICFDYEIRVQCCGPCPSTTTMTSPPSTTPTTSTTTPTTKTKTSTTSSSTEPSTPPCFEPLSCQWSDWIDRSGPSPGPNGGDTESVSQLINSGHGCTQSKIISDVECRAKRYPTLSLSKLGQEVICNPSVGLLCLNKNQANKQECFNYEIRVSCCLPCEPVIIPTTQSSTTAPSTPTTSTSTTTSTTAPTTETPSTPVSMTLPITTTTSSTSTAPTPAPCTCEWSGWIDLGPPTPGPDGGDSSTLLRTMHNHYHTYKYINSLYTYNSNINNNLHNSYNH